MCVPYPNHTYPCMDPVDALDPVEALNRVFPDVESYAERSEEARVYAQQCVDHLQQQLEHRPDISELRTWAQRAPQDFQQLSRDTHEIQRTGNETLANVQSVTSGIRRLDVAKENLMATIRMLRQLKMLTNLYVQLDSLLKERRYEDMTGAVRAASDLIDYFRPFRPLPQISKISQEIGDMENKIYEQIEGDFGQTLSAPGDPSNSSAAALNAACTVLNSLDSASGKKAYQHKIVEFYCEHMLKEYTQIFTPNDEAGSLENVKRRFTYLKNKVLLVYLSSHHKFFPPDWTVRQVLVDRACDLTARDLVVQLRRLNGGNDDQIQLLLTTLQECDDFEWFAKCEGKLTVHIAPFLSMWVEFQDRQLVHRVNTYAKMLVPPDTLDDVIPSSKELVNFYRALLAQLAKLKYQQGTLRHMAAVMADHLGHYATKVLLAYLPSHYVRSSDELRIVGLVDATAEYIVATTHQLERNIASQIDAAKEAEPTPTPNEEKPSAALSPQSQSKADDPDSSVIDSSVVEETTAEKIEAVFEHTLSRYRHVELRTEDLLVGYAQRSLEPLWIEMSQRFAAVHRGAHNTDVSRVSPFTSEIINHINSLYTQIFAAAPQPAVVFNVGSRVAESVCIGFLTMALARIPKPVGDSQAEQLLLDFGTIKSQSLLKASSFAPPEVSQKRGANRLERLSPRILEITSQAEAVLKLLMTPSDPIETFVMNYQVLVKDRSTINFRKILDVKGVRLQNEAISKFKLMASQEPQLIPENHILKSISTVPPPASGGFAFDNSFGLAPASPGTQSPGGFNMNQFMKLGGLLRRE